MEAKNYKVLLFLLLIVLCSSCNEKPVGVNSFDIVEKVVVYDSDDIAMNNWVVLDYQKCTEMY